MTRMLQSTLAHLDSQQSHIVKMNIDQPIGVPLCDKKAYKSTFSPP
jgi:hypothetical protein